MPARKERFEFSKHRVKPVRPPLEVNDVWRPLEPHERFLLSGAKFQLDEQKVGLTGNYLAALMLFGRGALVVEKFGDWSDGPDKSMTSKLTPEAERALCEAYAAYREAESIVGAYPLEQQTEADRLRKEQRLAKDAANAKYGVGKEPFHVVKAEPSMSAADIATATAARAHNARLDEGIKNVREATADISPRLDAANNSASSAYEAWLNAMVRELLQPAPASQPAANPMPVAGTKPDITLMATRQQLIDAFGSFTGMDASWFSNLKDTPAVLAARKVTGQGGRGRLTEPLFCPFEVLQWLIDPARRKGKPLGQDKGWELFERNFPRAYAAFFSSVHRTD